MGTSLFQVFLPRGLRCCHASTNSFKVIEWGSGLVSMYFLASFLQERKIFWAVCGNFSIVLCTSHSGSMHSKINPQRSLVSLILSKFCPLGLKTSRSCFFKSSLR